MNRLSQFLGAAAVIIIAVVFVIQFRPANSVARVDSGPACVAEIKGACIPASSFWASFRLLTYRGLDQAKARGMGLRRQTAEGLLEQWLLNQDAKRLGLTVSDDDVSREIVAGRAHVSLPAERLRQLAYSLGLGEELVSPLMVKDRKTKRFDSRTYEKDVRVRTRMSPTEFREYQRQELVAARMRDLVRQRVNVGEAEAYEQFSREKSTVTLDVVRLDASFFADLVVQVTDAAVSAYQEQHKAELDKKWEGRKAQYGDECRVTRHILARLEPTASEERKADAKKRIERAIERLGAGEDFKVVAQSMSDDSTAGAGGPLGCVPRGQMVKRFEDAVFALDAGKTSGLVETEFGLHVIHVEAIAKGPEVEKTVRRALAEDAYREAEASRLAALVAKEIQAAVKGGKTLADALAAALDANLPKRPATKADAKKDGKADPKKADEKPALPGERAPVTLETHPDRPVVETTPAFNATGEPIQGVRAGTELARLAFELKTPGELLPDVVPLEGGGFAVGLLKERASASKEQWDKDREFYVSAMRAAKQQDALNAYIKRLRELLASDVKYNQDLITEPKAGKDGEAAPEELPEE